MKFYKYLYIGDTVKNPVKAKSRLKLHIGQNLYIISISHGPDQLEIYHCAYLKQRYYRYHPPVVVGIASSHEEAVDIVVKIAGECLAATGGCDLKEYLKQKAKGSLDKI